MFNQIKWCIVSQSQCDNKSDDNLNYQLYQKHVMKTKENKKKKSNKNITKNTNKTNNTQ